MALPEIEDLAQAINSAVPGADVHVWSNESPSGQHALILPSSHALACARWLKEASPWKLDYLSNVTGVDWPDHIETPIKEKPTLKDCEDVVEGHRVKESVPGYLEVVYHLYSMQHAVGPVILRLRTENRSDRTSLPSLTPVWRSAELQEREVYDLFGVWFEGHPDLRRILMWDGFEDHPMRKDYVDPDDYEYEPTPHGEVIARVAQHRQCEGQNRKEGK